MVLIQQQIREDLKTGVYVENLREVEVTCVQDVVQLLVQVSPKTKFLHDYTQ
jgi:kinesin family protein 15